MPRIEYVIENNGRLTMKLANQPERKLFVQNYPARAASLDRGGWVPMYRREQREDTPQTGQQPARRPIVYISNGPISPSSPVTTPPSTSSTPPQSTTESVKIERENERLKNNKSSVVEIALVTYADDDEHESSSERPIESSTYLDELRSGHSYAANEGSDQQLSGGLRSGHSYATQAQTRGDKETKQPRDEEYQSRQPPLEQITQEHEGDKKKKPVAAPKNDLDIANADEPDEVIRPEAKIDVKCMSKESMRVTITFAQPFNGIVYARGFYSDVSCHFVRPNSADTEFEFELHANSCGTTFFDDEQDREETTLENALIIQSKAQYQDENDIARHVQCNWSDRKRQAVSAAVTVDPLPGKSLQYSKNDDNVETVMEIQLGRGPDAEPAESEAVRIGELITPVIYLRGNNVH